MAERYIPEHRRTQFKAKNTFKPEELRRRREEQQVEIRKAKREENLAKRRGITGGDGSRPGASLGAEPDSDDDTAPTESQVSLSPEPRDSLRITIFPIAELLQSPRRPRMSSPLFTFSGGVAHCEIFLFACAEWSPMAVPLFRDHRGRYLALGGYYFENDSNQYANHVLFS